jgi:hypothetical protein
LLVSLKKAALIAPIVICASSAAFAQAPEENPYGDPDAGAPEPAAEPEVEDEEYPLLRQTNRVAGVHVRRHKWSPVTSKVYPRAVLAVRQTGGGGGCPQGWFEREGGGYICGKNLRKPRPIPENETAHPAPRDDPEILEGVELWTVTKTGPRLYRSLQHIDAHRKEKTLFKGAVVTVRRTFIRYGTEYHQTREGWYVESRNTERLPPPIRELGVDVAADADLPGGLVISEDAPVFGAPGGEEEPLRTLERWTLIPRAEGTPLSVADGWVRLPDGGYLADEHLARVRVRKKLERIGDDERWIAVDLDEQLVHAYEGDRLLRVMPCSTGIRGNTRPGRYRIQWKRRLQTLRPKAGHLRVEDVQWVMYYDRRRSIAIHTAYWHDDFGRRHSLGCVNLPIDDARWVFDFSLPFARPEDSEALQIRRRPGTRVIVFED